MLYGESSTEYKENYGTPDDYTIVITLPSLWLMTEDDNYLVSETGDYLCIY